MSICLRAGHRYNRHSYVEKKVRGQVSSRTKECVHCGHPRGLYRPAKEFVQEYMIPAFVDCCQLDKEE
jgi:ribosomal protein S14